jgi:hypothetical protein
MKDNLNSIAKYPNRKLNEDYIIVFPCYVKERAKKSKNSSNIDQNKKFEKAKYVENYK